ncbi:MAG: AtzE family amidohydrolase [Betaproteobacteria bacterium]|nr:AtzE family amidohydrolase [Betaproteobacteria bacterium]
MRNTDSAVGRVAAAIETIECRDGALNCFTQVTSRRAQAEAARLDESMARGASRPVLAGKTYAVKNLFDIEGEVTLAGLSLNAHREAASSDAVLIDRLQRAGAIMLGALNMDACAYGFTTENTAYGSTRNPHDLERSAGGSSGGSAAAVAAGLVDFSLGSDTNGSIRVPSSFCGVFGLKPTYGRLPRTGTFPFVNSLDHLGPFARDVRTLAAVYDAMQGPDSGDPACAQRPAEPTMAQLDGGISNLRVARLMGYFDVWAGPEARAASLNVAQTLGAYEEVELPSVERARAAAFLITAAEAGQLHMPALKQHYDDFEPLIRDRLLAGGLQPASWYLHAQRVRSWFRTRVLELMQQYDVLIAPATPFPATRLGKEWVELNGQRLPLRPNVGLMTQPISFIGLPVVAVPLKGAGHLPMAVQVIGAPWREDNCLRVAAWLQRSGAAYCEVVHA